MKTTWECLLDSDANIIPGFVQEPLYSLAHFSRANNDKLK